MNMDFDRKLAIPAEVKEMYPLSRPLADIVDRRRVAVKEIISGHSDKLLLVIGPCSADNEDSVIDYISRLRTVQEIKGRLLDCGALGAIMTGTGSAVFGVFLPGAIPLGAAETLRRDYGFCKEAVCIPRLL